MHICFPRNKRLIISMVLLAILGSITGCSGSAGNSSNGSSQPLELRLAHFWPDSHPAERELVQPWAKAIEEATEGRVRITSYPNQTLLQADGIYDGVVNGEADIGISCFSYTRGRFPVLEVFELPGFTYPNSEVASRVAWEGIKQLNPVEIQDTKLLMVLTTGPGDLYTKKPITNLEDLKGLEIRATGLSAKTLEALGATPVGMAQSEAYEAMSKGIVQGNLGPIEVLRGWRQAEVTKCVTLTPFLYNTLFFVTMNQDKWNSISAADQEVIEQINQEFFDEVAAGLWDKQNRDAMKWAVEEQGIQIIELSPEEKDRWISLVKPIQDEFIHRLDKLGYSGQEVLMTVQNLVEKYNQEYQ